MDKLPQITNRGGIRVKKHEVKVGVTYSNGAHGKHHATRKVTHITNEGMVHYLHSGFRRPWQMTNDKCLLESFARWARGGVVA
jgi:hypothetical protein